MKTPKRPGITDGMRRLLEALYQSEYGVFDRWVRIVVAGEVVTHAGSTVALTAFRYSFIQMHCGTDHVELTTHGLKYLQEHGGGVDKAASN